MWSVTRLACEAGRSHAARLVVIVPLHRDQGSLGNAKKRSEDDPRRAFERTIRELLYGALINKDNGARNVGWWRLAQNLQAIVSQ